MGISLIQSVMQENWDLATVEYWVRWLGAFDVLLVLVFIFLGIWQGIRKPAGTTAGQVSELLHSPIFYTVSSLIFFGICFLLWKPLLLTLSSPLRTAAIFLGSLLFFGGLALTLWARITLGKNYFVSTSLGVQLFAKHQLVTSGPFAWVRHPMYLGLILANFGGLLLYRTWTELFLSVGFLGLVIRARREEQALSSAFGPAWQEYIKRTPAWLPKLAGGKHDLFGKEDL